MTVSSGQSVPSTAPLPDRALLIAPTVERAAVLGVAFEVTHIATPEGLVELLASTGPDFPCVAITGVPTRGDRLGSVVRQVLGACPPEVEVLIDVREPAGADVADAGEAALAGLLPVDFVELWDVPCLRLRRGPHREAQPDLRPWRQALLERGAPAGVVGDDPLRLAAQVQAGPLRERIAELEVEVAGLRTSLATAKATLGNVQATERAARDAVARLQTSRLARVLLRVGALTRRVPGVAGGDRSARLIRLLAACAVGLAVLVAVAALVASLTDTGYVGGAVTVALGLTAAQLAYLWLAQGRLATRIERTARRTEDSVASEAGSRRQHDKLVRELSEVQTRLKEIEHDLAIIAATTVDIAQAFAPLRSSDAGAEPDAR